VTQALSLDRSLTPQTPSPVREGVRADAAAPRELQVRQVPAITQRQPAFHFGSSVHPNQRRVQGGVCQMGVAEQLHW